MLRIGFIGFGHRALGMTQALQQIKNIPWRVAAVADPRAKEIAAAHADIIGSPQFFVDADAMLQEAELDGIFIGTRCNIHTEMACKAASRGLPLFLEKPVAINWLQLRQLNETFKDYSAPVVVSFPLRLTPIAQEVKRLIDAGEIGTVEHVVAVNDPSYAATYYTNWYRNFDTTGGLFLQKATHDLDYIAYLLGQRPRSICAMTSQRVYGPAGSVHAPMPYEQRCTDCPDRTTCDESPLNPHFARIPPFGMPPIEHRMCMFSEGIRNEDVGQCIIEYDNGCQATYTQNFIARNSAERRGARLVGYKGTIDFDWKRREITLHRHDRPQVQTTRFQESGAHGGGDVELALDFLLAMKERRPSRTPISAGIESALTCLWARESAIKRRFCDVVMPED